ncbi:hypothetical protein QFC19_008683 [Naganishia cerealis]|uniref:Uncharacterized protein n=1 Tax=Naganishia cerealis TaxID=610337 RepID=A0ACC2UZR5_9TREE|nr:hypothetical protein QFC19_008683 [Naganishia cerealis]
MSYASHSVATAVIDRSKPFLFGMHKLLAERTKNLAPGVSKKPLIGQWSMLPGANLARMIASQGFDFILVDCEHGNISDSEMHTVVSAIGNTPGCSPMIRIPAPELFLVKRALDTGAHALMCPLVSTAEEARRFVSYAKFPQRKAQRPSSDILTSSKYAALPGVRGAGSPFAPALWKMEMKDYFDLANEGIFLVVQIETEEGLQNCEEIAKVEGIDMLFVGPNDLCSSMGYPPPEHPNIPEVQDAIERIRKAAHAAGKYAGMFCTQPEQVLARAEQGFDLMNMGMDFAAVQQWNADALEAVKSLR